MTWLTNPLTVDLSNCHVFVGGRLRRNIRDVVMFLSDYSKFFAITYENGVTKHHTESEVDIRSSCLSGESGDIFDYLKQSAGINTLGISDGVSAYEGMLASIYSDRAV
ncbi:MAG: hypothetical protein NC039_08580 [Muribaculaceae bacterium]|nr:hypothetical protein [Muribaculaceae bacterium]